MLVKIFTESAPVDWLVSGLLGLVWIALWAVRKRAPPWFFVVGAVLAVLCFPAGMAAGRLELGGVHNCTPGTLCFSMNEVHWWWNGLLGLLTNAALGLVTVAITGAFAARRRTRSTGHTTPRGEITD